MFLGLLAPEAGLDREGEGRTHGSGLTMGAGATDNIQLEGISPAMGHRLAGQRGCCSPTSSTRGLVNFSLKGQSSLAFQVVKDCQLSLHKHSQRQHLSKWAHCFNKGFMDIEVLISCYKIMFQPFKYQGRTKPGGGWAVAVTAAYPSAGLSPGWGGQGAPRL